MIEVNFYFAEAILIQAMLNFPKRTALREKSRPVKTVPESPWKQKLKKSNKDELISFLAPPKAAKSEYEKQEPSEYVFKCLDGDIHIPEYGIRRTDFYYEQSKARKVDENGHIFNYQKFPRLGFGIILRQI